MPRDTVPIATPGNCHRIALAVHDFPGALDQWRRVFGAALMVEPVHDPVNRCDQAIVWMGDVPVLALGASDTDGLVGRWLAKHGPGVQSLAWEVPDLWAAQNLLEQAGIGITGVHVTQRHFFLHPRDTFGLLLELSDGHIDHDPRTGGTPIGGGDGIVPVVRVAHVTGVVTDLEPVASFLGTVFGAEPAPVADGGAERMTDFELGDLTLRLVEPRDPSSPWHDGIAAGRGALHSVALGVDLAAARSDLRTSGIGVEREHTGSLWLDPADTFGIRLQLVEARVPPQARTPSTEVASG
jgi:methylmalonyl-CoA/ethylmalonyl-CoA epimerase